MLTVTMFNFSITGPVDLHFHYFLVVSRILYSPHSQKPGGPAVLAVHGTHHLVLSVALLPPDSPSEARFGTYEHRRREKVTLLWILH